MPDRDRRLLAIVPGGLYTAAEIVLLRDLEEMRRRGWEIRVACADGPLLDRLRTAGIPRVTIPDLRLPDGNRAIALTALATRIIGSTVAIRRTLRPGEVVLANGLNTLPVVRAVRAGRRRSSSATNPTVWLAHDVLVRGDRLRLLRLSRHAVDHAIAVSEATAAPLRAVGMEPTVVWNGTRWPVDPAPEELSGPPIIGLASVLTAHKGHLVLLDAVARMRRRDAIVELLGGVLPKDGGFASTLRERATRLDLNGRVRFLGYEDDPLARLRTWTVSVSASIDPEAGPLTALEAMSLGVPFVATNHGGVVEVLGDAGLLVAPNDAPALADALDRMLDDAELRARCRAAGPAIIRDRQLTIDHHTTAVVDQIERIVEKSPSSGS